MTARARYWLDLLSAWERSGLSQAEFCRRRGVKGVTFAWWKRQLRRESEGSAKRPSAESPRFVEVRLAGSSASYEVMLSGGRSIRVPATFEAESLSRLIAAVESC
jgi:hypothetical protein